MARPSLADSLMASLNKGVHVETAEKIARGLPPIPHDTEVIITPVAIAPVTLVVPDPVVNDVIVEPIMISDTPVSISTPVPQKSPKSKKTPPTPNNGQSVGQSLEQSNGLSIGQTNGRTNGATVGLSDKRTDGASIGRTSQLSDDLTSDLSDDLTSDLSDGQTSAIATGQSDERTVKPTAGQPDHRTGDQSKEQPEGQSSERSVERTEGRSEGPAARSIWAPLTENQGRVLQYLYDVADGLTNVDTISSETVIAYGTVRKCIDVLMKEGYIQDKRRFNGHAFNGFEYWLNNHLCSIYLTRVKSGQSIGLSQGRTDGQSIGRSVERTLGLSNERTTALSSSRFLEELKPTTTQTVVEGTVLTGAVGAYWEEEGLGEAQAKKWCTQFEVDPEQMRSQLDWARFDLETNNRKESVTKDSVSWFFGHLRTTGGCFPKPVNYKSPAELRAAAILEQQKRDEEAKAVIAASDFENKFQAFLTNPEAPLFQQLFEQLNGFAKEQYKSGSKREAEIELRELFKSYIKQEGSCAV